MRDGEYERLVHLLSTCQTSSAMPENIHPAKGLTFKTKFQLHENPRLYVFVYDFCMSIRITCPSLYDNGIVYVPFIVINLDL